MMEGPWCRFRREARAREQHRHAAVDSLKVLDPKWPIREATLCVRRSEVTLRAMYGRRPRCKRNLTYLRSVRVQPCWDGRPHFPRLPPDHKIGHAIRTTEMEHDDCGDRSRSGQERFSSSWNRRERSCGSQTEDTAIGGIAVIFQTSAGARWNGSMPYFALLGA